MNQIIYLRIAFVQALVAMLGSLYFSNFGDPIKNIMDGNFFGGPAFDPCHLCRWARIVMYPLVWISFVGLLRKDPKVAYTILPVSLAGMVLTGYHYTIQYVNSLNVVTCAPGNPCTLIDWKIFGVITIPALAFIAFTVISVCMIIILSKQRKES